MRQISGFLGIDKVNGEEGRDYMGTQGNFWIISMFNCLMVAVFSQIYKYVKIYQTVHLKHMHFIVCQFTFKMFLKLKKRKRKLRGKFLLGKDESQSGKNRKLWQ